MPDYTADTLPVPDRAVVGLTEVALRCERSGHVHFGPLAVADDVRDVAAPVVAAELRRRADHLAWLAARNITESDVAVLREIERDLRTRADALDLRRW